MPANQVIGWQQDSRVGISQSGNTGFSWSLPLTLGMSLCPLGLFVTLQNPDRETKALLALATY